LLSNIKRRAQNIEPFGIAFGAFQPFVQIQQAGDDIVRRLVGIVEIFCVDFSDVNTLQQHT